jgi:hypothetical protein
LYALNALVMLYIYTYIYIHTGNIQHDPLVFASAATGLGSHGCLTGATGEQLPRTDSEATPGSSRYEYIGIYIPHYFRNP